MIFLTIPRIPKSPNRGRGVIGWSIWSSARKERDVWRAELAFALRTTFGFKGWNHNNRRRRVVITQYRKRLLDKDNLYTSVKRLVDAMRDLQFIKQDSERWVDLKALQEKSAEERTTILIEDLK